MSDRMCFKAMLLCFGIALLLFGLRHWDLSFHTNRTTPHNWMETRYGVMYEYGPLSYVGRGENVATISVGRYLDVSTRPAGPPADVHADVYPTVRNADGSAQDILVMDPAHAGPRKNEYIEGAVSLWRWNALRPGVAIVEFRNAKHALVGTLRVTVTKDPPDNL